MKVYSDLPDRFTKSSKTSGLKAKRALRPEKLHVVYKTLRKRFRHQKWWPGETPFEIIIGAILTQNTAWTNVEKAIANLKQTDVLTVSEMSRISERALASLIRPAGFFNIKAKRIKAFLHFLNGEYGGSLARMRRQKSSVLRGQLLAVNGIGPETADCILLYALDKPYFVIDAYTRRIFSRHGLMDSEARYGDWQALFTRHLPVRRGLYGDFHAQIVRLAKERCRSSRAFCSSCPLKLFL